MGAWRNHGNVDVDGDADVDCSANRGCRDDPRRRPLRRPPSSRDSIQCRGTIRRLRRSTNRSAPRTLPVRTRGLRSSNTRRRSLAKMTAPVMTTPRLRHVVRRDVRIVIDCESSARSIRTDTIAALLPVRGAAPACCCIGQVGTGTKGRRHRLCADARGALSRQSSGSLKCVVAACGTRESRGPGTGSRRRGSVRIVAVEETDVGVGERGRVGANPVCGDRLPTAAATVDLRSAHRTGRAPTTLARTTAIVAVSVACFSSCMRTVDPHDIGSIDARPSSDESRAELARDDARDGAPRDNFDSAVSDTRDDTDSAVIDAVDDYRCTVPDDYVGPPGPTTPLPGELEYPWHSSRCTVWTSSVPRLDYPSSASNEEGVWFIGRPLLNNDIPRQPFVMRHSGGHWFLTAPPFSFSRYGFPQVAAGPSWVAAEAGAEIAYHENGGDWHLLRDMGFFPRAVWSGGGDLFALSTASPRIHRYNGLNWEHFDPPLPPLPPSGLLRAAGGVSDLFVADGSTFTHFDGMHWSELPQPPYRCTNGAVLAVPSRNELVTSSGGAVCRWDGHTWADVTPSLPPECAPGSGFGGNFEIWSASGAPRLSRACLFDETTWWRWSNPLGAFVRLPDSAGVRTATIADDGVLNVLRDTRPYAGMATLEIRPTHLGCSGWVADPVIQSLTLTAPHLPAIAAVSSDEVYVTLGLGIARLRTDGSFDTVPGTEALGIDRLSIASDGTMFCLSVGASSPTFDIGRMVSGAWQRDATYSYFGYAVFESPPGNLLVRTATDAYLAAGGVYHWDGSHWSSVPFAAPPGAECHAASLAVGTAGTMFVGCARRPYGSAAPIVLQCTPTGGCVYAGTDPVWPGGVENSFGLRSNSEGWVQWSDGGAWTSLASSALGWSPPLAAATVDTVIAGVGARLYRYRAETGWIALDDRLAGLINAPVTWTDGRHVALRDASGAALCDFGP